MSKWHVIPLDENQLKYAAIDVYVRLSQYFHVLFKKKLFFFSYKIGQLIYRELEKREKIKKQNEEEFKERNGEEAFKAVKALGETFLGPSNEIAI